MKYKNLINIIKVIKLLFARLTYVFLLVLFFLFAEIYKNSKYFKILIKHFLLKFLIIKDKFFQVIILQLFCVFTITIAVANIF